MLLIVVALVNTIDTTLNLNGVLRSVVLGFYIANEGISLLENAGKCGVPIPEKVVEVLKQLQEKEDV